MVNIMDLGMGYGLNKMFEGSTGGMLRGTLAKMQLDDAALDRQATHDYRDKSLDLQQQRLDLSKQQITNQQDLARIQRGANAIKTALDAYTKTGNKDVFNVIYKSMDPEGEIPDIDLDNNRNTVSINWKGMKIKGYQDKIQDAVRIISQNPEKSPEVLQKLAELGLAEIEIPKEKPDKEKFITVSPGQTVIDSTGKQIYTAPEKEKPEGDKEGDITEQQKFLATQQNRVTKEVDRLYGASDFSGLLPDIADKAGDAKELATQYVADGMDIGKAANRAKQETDRIYSSLESIPKADKGGLMGLDKDNIPETVGIVKVLLSFNLDQNKIMLRLEKKGWSNEQAVDILKKAGGIENTTKDNDKSEIQLIQERYNLYRNQGKSPEEALRLANQ